MIGFKVRLIPLPEQPSEPQVSVHWFFLPAALFYLAGGWACLREYFFRRGSPALLYPGWFCIFLGLFVLVTFGLCLGRIRAGRPPKTLFTVRVRLLVLAGVMAGYVALPVVFFRFLPGKIAWLLPLFWVLSGAWVWNSIVRYFLRHPPRH